MSAKGGERSREREDGQSREEWESRQAEDSAVRAGLDEERRSRELQGREFEGREVEGQKPSQTRGRSMRKPLASGSGGARSVVVNRTHRVVREQAIQLQEQRRRKRGLWVPLIIFSSLMMAICYAAWAMLGGYDLTPNGIPDASDQLMILLLWSLPVTAVVLGLVWLKRGRGRIGNNEAQP